MGTVATRERDFWGWLREWCHKDQRKLYDLPVALRWEKGELGGRPHAHALLSGFSRASVRIAFQQIHAWNHKQTCKNRNCDGCGFGIARVRLYELRGENAEGYICKGAGNVYEIRKFDTADRICVNGAAWRLMLAAVGLPESTVQHATI